MNQVEQEIFFEIFSPYADKIFLEHLSRPWVNFAYSYDMDNVKSGHYGQQIEMRKVCPFIFYTMVINSDGTVSSCVADWGHDLLVGDIKINSVYDVWNGEAFNKLRVKHLRGFRKEESLCANCECIIYGCLDNIDSYAECALKNEYFKEAL